VYGVWVLDETAVAYIRSVPSRDDPTKGGGLGRLELFTPADGSTRRLGGGVSILRRAMPGKNAATLYVSQCLYAHETDEPDEREDAPLDQTQIVEFDLNSGARRIVTDEPDGAFWPAPDPTGRRLAYYTARKGTRAGWPDDLLPRVRSIESGPAQGIDCAGE
jgi:hypothetical protein